MIDYEEDILSGQRAKSDRVGHPTLTESESSNSHKYAIEKGVPLPKPGRERYDWDASPYPFGAMEPGDSFLVPLAPGQTMKHLRGKVAAKCKAWRLRFNRADVKFRTGLDADGLRIWRAE